MRRHCRESVRSTSWAHKIQLSHWSNAFSATPTGLFAAETLRDVVLSQLRSRSFPFNASAPRQLVTAAPRTPPHALARFELVRSLRLPWPRPARPSLARTTARKAGTRNKSASGYRRVGADGPDTRSSGSWTSATAPTASSISWPGRSVRDSVAGSDSPETRGRDGSSASTSRLTGQWEPRDHVGATYAFTKWLVDQGERGCSENDDDDEESLFTLRPATKARVQKRPSQIRVLRPRGAHPLPAAG